MHETYFPDSTALHSAAYDEETQELTIRLTTGRSYVYRGVEEWVYDGLLTSESAGKYYNIRIKDRYPYAEILGHEGLPVRPRCSPASPPSPRRIDLGRGNRARRFQGHRGRRG